AADFRGRNLRRDREHRNPASVRVEQAVDEMQVARPAGAGTDRELAGHLRLAGRGDCRYFLMAHMHPFDRAAAAQRLGEAVQAVADDPEDAFDAGLLQGCYEQIGYVVDRHGILQSGGVSCPDGADGGLSSQPWGSGGGTKPPNSRSSSSAK